MDQEYVSCCWQGGQHYFRTPRNMAQQTMNYYINDNCVGERMTQGFLVDGGTTYYFTEKQQADSKTTLSSNSGPRPIYQGVKTRLNFLDPAVRAGIPQVFRMELRRFSKTLLSVTHQYDNDTCLDIVSFEFKISSFSYVNGRPVRDPVAVVSILSKYDGRLGFQFEIINEDLAQNCNISVDSLQEICEQICL